MKENAETLEELDVLLQHVKDAQTHYASFSQEAVDGIFSAAAQAAEKEANSLAQMAVTETGMGVVAHKVIKNRFASTFIYRHYRDTPTCGVVGHQGDSQIIAHPIGVIAGVIPTTNPTATTIFKALLALKTRNAIVFSPHPRAAQCTIEAAKIVARASVQAGAPQGLIAWISAPTLPMTDGLMKHPLVDLILATGGPGMVKAAYSSGKPALGVGAGNTAALIDESADVKAAVKAILESKTFDNGVICASEQAIVAVEKIYDAVREELVRGKAYILSAEEERKIGGIILTEKGINPDIVGKSPRHIAAMVGISVKESCSVLVGEETSCDGANPFAHEKLSPVLALYRAKDFPAALAMARQLITLGGAGHTAVLHVNRKEQKKINAFAETIPAGRILVNSPASQGAIGLCNSNIAPSLTLGCGSWGGNSTSENISIKHLLNYKIVAPQQDNPPTF